jgi:PilZ domain-containing protein
MQTMQTGRTEQRMATNAVANLEAADEPSINETAVFTNISEHGARLITGRYWSRGKQVIVSDSLVNFRTRAEVVYCAPYSSRRYAVGLKFNWSHALASHRFGQKDL